MTQDQIELSFKPYVDEWGLLVEDPWEGGDAACETFYALGKLKMSGHAKFVDGRKLGIAYVDTASKLIHMPTGLWRRHCAVNTPNGWTDYWASEWDRGSRDNGTGAVICTILFNDSARTKAMLELCKKRWWLSPYVSPRNTWDREEDHIKYSKSWKKFDPTPRFGSPLLMWKSFFNRSVEKKWYTRSTLWFWDVLSCLLPVISILLNIKRGTNNGNHLNAILRAEFCRRNMPTLVSRLAFWLLPVDVGLEIEFPPGGKNPPMYLLD